MKKTNHKIRRVVIVIGGVLILSLLIGVCKSLIVQKSGPQLCFQQNCFSLEIADIAQSREKGLMFRTSLEADHGMLFVFDHPDFYSFRMKNTLIPLDMLWMDDAYNIVNIQNQAQPCTADPCPSYTPGTSANYVLEIKGGSAAGLGLKVGDKGVR